MKKRLRIYSLLFIVALVFWIITSIFQFEEKASYTIPDEKLEYVDMPADFGTDTVSDGKVLHNATISYEVSVVPRQNTKALFSNADNQTYKVEMQKVKLSAPLSESLIKGKPKALLIVSILILAIAFVWILVIVLKIVSSISKGEVFVAKVSKNLEKAGFLLCGVYITELIGSYAFMRYLMSCVRMADYEIVFRNECNIMFLFTGLGLMIISQIILLGKDLKDEQELTI